MGQQIVQVRVGQWGFLVDGKDITVREIPKRYPNAAFNFTPVCHKVRGSRIAEVKELFKSFGCKIA